MPQWISWQGRDDFGVHCGVSKLLLSGQHLPRKDLDSCWVCVNPHRHHHPMILCHGLQSLC